MKTKVLVDDGSNKIELFYSPGEYGFYSLYISNKYFSTDYRFNTNKDDRGIPNFWICEKYNGKTHVKVRQFIILPHESFHLETQLANQIKQIIKSKELQSE